MLWICWAITITIRNRILMQVLYVYTSVYVSFSSGSDRFKQTIRDKLSIDWLLHSGLFVGAFIVWMNQNDDSF